MTQVFDEQGRVVPATMIEVGKECVVVARRTMEKNGYVALQFGFGKANPKQFKKPIEGYFKKSGVEPTRVLREVRMDSTDGYEVGKYLSVELFKPGEKVHVMSKTKGRGFAGGVKRWGWSSGPRTHGSMSHRRVGSVGAGTSPGRVLPGRHLPGHYGNERVTIKNLRIVKIEPEKGILYVSGAVPGNRGGLVLVRSK